MTLLYTIVIGLMFAWVMLGGVALTACLGRAIAWGCRA